VPFGAIGGEEGRETAWALLKQSSLLDEGTMPLKSGLSPYGQPEGTDDDVPLVSLSPRLDFDVIGLGLFISGLICSFSMPLTCAELCCAYALVTEHSCCPKAIDAECVLLLPCTLTLC
jgi:hypothetical protein